MLAQRDQNPYSTQAHVTVTRPLFFPQPIKLPCLCVYVYVCVCVCVCVCACVCVKTRYMHACVQCVRVYLHACWDSCMLACTCVYACMCVCVHAYVCVNMRMRVLAYGCMQGCVVRRICIFSVLNKSGRIIRWKTLLIFAFLGNFRPSNGLSVSFHGTLLKRVIRQMPILYFVRYIYPRNIPPPLATPSLEW